MRVLITIAAASMMLIILAVPAHAAAVCNCGPMAPEEAARHATYVVEGVAIDKWTDLWPDVHHYADHASVMPLETYLFRVARSWGSWMPYRHDELELVQGYTFCDHHFAIGHRYLMVIYSDDAPAIMYASGCIRFFEGAEIPAFAVTLGPPAASFALPDTIPVSSSPGLRRRLRTYLIASAAVYGWLYASHGTGRAFEASPWSTSPNRSAAIRTAWGGLIATILAFFASIIAIARRPPRRVSWLSRAASSSSAVCFQAWC